MHIQLYFCLDSSGHLGSPKCPQPLQQHAANREKSNSKENGLELIILLLSFFKIHISIFNTLVIPSQA